MKRSFSRPPLRSAYHRIKGGCDCPDCAPSSRLGKALAWLDGSAGGWSTVLCLAALIAVVLGYYYFYPAADASIAAALRG